MLHLRVARLALLRELKCLPTNISTPVPFIRTGLKLSNAMTSVKPALSASTTWTGRRNSGDEEDADTRNTPSDESRPGKAHIRWMSPLGRSFHIGRAGKAASLSMAPCEKVAGSAFRNPYRGVRRCGLPARLSQQVPLRRAPQIRRCTCLK